MVVNKRGLTFAAIFACIVFFLLVSLSAPAYAVPASPFPVEATQANGATISISLKGDEFFHWSEDENGYVIAYDASSGNWCYARLAQNRIVPGNEIVNPRSRAAMPRITAEALEPLIANAPHFSAPQPVRPQSFGMGPAAAPVLTNQDLLVVLVEFDDVQMQKDNAYWHKKYFSTTAGDKSVADYFKTMSEGSTIFKPASTAAISDATNKGPLSYASVADAYGGQALTYANIYYDLTADAANPGVVKVKLHMNHPVLSWNTAKAADPNGSNLLRAAMALALRAIYAEGYAVPAANLHIAGIIAGGESSCGIDAYGTWAHAWGFNGTLTLGTTAMGRYMVHGEMYNGSNTMDIGVACHELGHTLGLPDLYDTDYSSEGVGPFSLMAGGSWGSAPGDTVGGQTPVALDAWSKIVLGYITPDTIPSGTYAQKNVNRMTGLNTYNALKLTNASLPAAEYFLIENRGLEGYDQGLYGLGVNSINGNGDGILILHCDDARPDNTTDGHRLVDVEEADGLRILDAPYGNPSSYNHFFSTRPYKGNIYDRFNPTSTPNSNFYNSTTATTQATPSNIRVRVKSAPAAIMQVEIGIKAEVGAQSGALVAGTPGTVTFPVTTMNIPNGTYPVAVNNLPAGVTISSGQVVIANDAGTLTLAGDAATVNGSSTLTLTIDGTTSGNFTLVVGALAKTVTVGAQSGALTAGTPGTVTFPVTTSGIADGNYPATVNNLPAGVTVSSGQVTIAGNAGTLTLTGGAAMVNGSSTLTLQIDGTTSGNFTLVINNAPASTPQDNSAFSGSTRVDDPSISSISATPISGGARLSVSANSGIFAQRYRWQYRGSWIDIPGATSPTFDWVGLVPGMSYTVRCIVLNSAGGETISKEITFIAGGQANVGVLLGNDVKVRTGPDAKTKELGKLKKNDQITILGFEAPLGWRYGYYKIAWDGGVAYISADYVDATFSAPLSANITGRAYLQSSMDANKKYRLTTLSMGDTVRFIGRYKIWWVVEQGGMKSYLMNGKVIQGVQ